MIAAISARLLVALICFLALATSASAECAWVLWSSVLKERDWEPIQAFHYDSDSQKVCETERLKHAEADYQLGVETYEKTGITTPERLRSLRVLVEDSHRCLPDTIDPRGPKGK